MVGGDLDGDGKPGLVTIDGELNQITVLLGRGDGTFTTFAQFAAGTGTSSVALVDLDGDNRLDLAVTAASGLLIFTGRGDGTFSGRRQLLVRLDTSQIMRLRKQLDHQYHTQDCPGGLGQDRGRTEITGIHQNCLQTAELRV